MKYILLVLMGAILLAACSPTTPVGPETGRTPEPETTREPPAATSTLEESQPTQAPAVGGQFEDGADGLIAGLTESGVTVEDMGSLDQTFFPVEGRLLVVNGADLQVFEFEDEGTAEDAAALVGANGSMIGQIPVQWEGQPHFWSGGRLLVLYVGDDAELVNVLTDVMGEEIDLSETADVLPPAAALEAQEALMEKFAIPADLVQILSAEQTEFPDACLGLAEEDELCAQVITPGWLFEVEVQGIRYEVRTDESGGVIRFRPMS